MQRLALAHRHYGYRRIGALLRQQGIVENHKRLLRLLREDCLLCLRRRAFMPMATQSDAGRWCRTWCTGSRQPRRTKSGLPTSPIRLREDFVYLAVVLDAFSRKVVGWVLDAHLRASLAIEAL
jgi:transposase InsO family protein